MTQNLFHIVLLQPEIPHNTGAIGRLCVGLGWPLHLIRPLGFHLSDEYVRRAGLDYWEFLRLTVHGSWGDFIESVKPTSVHFLSTKTERSIYECNFQAGGALVFGNESRGLPPEMYAQYAADLCQIPMPGEHARSINLANAVSITAYEAYRQTCGSA